MQLAERVIPTLRSRLESAGVTQGQIADRLGISQAAVSRRLRGEVSLDLVDIEVIAELLGIPPADVLADDPESAAPAVRAGA